MVEKKTKAASAEAKPEKAVKQPAAKAVPAKEVAKPQKKAATGGSITLRQIGSPIGRQGYQRSTLIGLGLNKLNRTRTLQDTPSIRGMIEKVKHLVEIVEA